MSQQGSSKRVCFLRSMLMCKISIKKIRYSYRLFCGIYIYIHTYVNTHTHTENRDERDNLLFVAVFRVQPARSLHFTTGFPRTEPEQPKTRTKPAFHPCVFPKRNLDSYKVTPNQKKVKKKSQNSSALRLRPSRCRQVPRRSRCP